MKGVSSLRSYVLGLIMRGRTLDPLIDPPHLKHNFKICYYHSFSCKISGFEKNDLITQVSFLYSLVPLPFLPFFTSSVFIMPSLQCRGSNKARKVTRKEPLRRTTVWEAQHSKVSTKRNIQLLCVQLKAATPELTVCFITFVIASEVYQQYTLHNSLGLKIQRTDLYQRSSTRQRSPMAHS